MYYNTNNEEQPQLFRSWAQTAKQNDLIYELFRRHPNNEYSPDEIHIMIDQIVIDTNGSKYWPITSIRRAISTLTKQGKLTKTNNLRKGKYGKQTHTWKFNREIRTDINDTDSPEHRNY